MLRYKNNVACTLAATLTDSATTITLTPGDGAQLPVIASGTADTFLITATDKNGNKEIISICRRDSGADTLYIGTGTAHQASGNILGRAQESTTARAVTYTDDHSISIYPTAAPFEAAVKYSDAGELTSTTTEINQLASSGVSTADLVKLHAVTASAATLNAVVTTARTITAGTGLSGGGTLAADRTIAHASHTGDVTGAAALTIAADAVKITNMQHGSIMLPIQASATISVGGISYVQVTPTYRVYIPADATTLQLSINAGGLGGGNVKFYCGTLESSAISANFTYQTINLDVSSLSGWQDLYISARSGSSGYPLEIPSFGFAWL